VRAKDLICQILREEEERLCSSKYMLNDRADRLSNFMYSDDASDAKAHAFFKGTNWGELHSRNTPFPAVANYKYSRRSSIDHVGTSKQMPYDKILRDEVFGEDAMKAREGADLSSSLPLFSAFFSLSYY
jgi:hypothetical protein